jgi:hypothetical protein
MYNYFEIVVELQKTTAAGFHLGWFAIGWFVSKQNCSKIACKIVLK